ncbi:hypothetical protein TRFO_17622 [Tritrichomonas foetus]|uniref:Uncharacterized protein n=1 Tax=Tritrichomonas foetus TaxID=1144522 RepID=A0A1J4KSM7_9EUKA|nr:hypothetical protein TRFO_17622 [Tritrichomonas foetus]|eukprot:OHT12477.1 hypothetical protein TRFO_17622 [Tritrichomonas foetus]
MSKNPLESSAATRVGLARHRPLSIKPLTSNQKSTTSSLPDGWYYNETKESDFWNDIEKSSVSKNEIHNDLLKQTEQITDLQDTSNKIRFLVNQFDDIDQDTLMLLMQLYDNETGDEAFDQQMIMNDSKTHILDFMGQLKDIGDSQTTLMETLRFWFTSLTQNSQTGDNEVSIDDLPDVTDIYDNLSEIVKVYTEKSEQAACLHNDMNDFWFKQVASYKRIVMLRDEEIRKLQKSIRDASVAAQARRARKKVEDKVQEPVNMQKEQLEKQLRLNQEMKQQIEKLKRELHENEIQKAALSSIRGNSTDKLKIELMEKDSDINTLKIEYETKNSSLQALINQLNVQIEVLKKSLQESEEKYTDLLNKHHQVQKDRDELDESLQKQLKLLSIERKKNEVTPHIVDESPIDRHELYEAEMKHQDEIRSLNMRHREEMVLQAETIREKYLTERNKLLSSLESEDTSSLLQSISDECDKKIQQQKDDFEQHEHSLIQGWAGKVALLTRQYENRIKALNAAHEVDLIMAKDAVKFEVKKAELDLEEKYNTQLLEIGREKQEKFNDFQRHLDKIQSENDSLSAENQKLFKQLTAVNMEKSVNNNKINIDREELIESNKNSPQKVSSALQSQRKAQKIMKQSEKEKLQEKYAMKLKLMKEEMDDQLNWSLEKQKNFYEREINKQIIEHQKDMRERLMELQEVIVQLQDSDLMKKDPEGGSSAVNSLMDEISTAFEQMNAQVESLDQNPSEPTLTVKEAADRTKKLTDKLIQLANENQELRTSQVFKEPPEDIIKQLQDKIAYFEALQTDDQKSAADKLKQIEDKYKHELDVKDQMLLNFQKINNHFNRISRKKIESILICDFGPKEIDDDLHLTMMTSPLRSFVGRKKVNNKKISINEVICDFDVFEEEEIKLVDPRMKNYINDNNPLVKAIPPSTISAPVENSNQLDKPPISYISKTSRKYGRRKIAYTLTQSVQTDKRKNELLVSTNEIFEIPEKIQNEGNHRPVAFLIDENLQSIIEADIIPNHEENEQKLVRDIVCEVFDRLPTSKTSDKQTSPQKMTPTSDRKMLDISYEDIKLSNYTSQKDSRITSQSVSPRAKALKIPHLSLVIIESVSITPNEKVVLAYSNIFTSFSQEPILVKEINNVIQQIPTINSTSSLEHMEPILLNNYKLSHAKNELNISNELILNEVLSVDFPLRNSHCEIFDYFHIKDKNNEKDVVYQITNGNSFTISAKKNESILNSSNLIIIDIPYSPANHPELNETVRLHIQELESELNELKGRPQNPPEVSIILQDVKLEPLKKIEVGKSYMPLTPEEVLKLKRKKPVVITNVKQNQNDKSNESLSTIEERNEKLNTSQESFFSNDENSRNKEDNSRSSTSSTKTRSSTVTAVSGESLGLTRELSTVSYDADPFAAARQILKASIIYTKRFIDEETELFSQLGETTAGYDAYINASGVTDEAHFSFLTSMNATKKNLDDHLGQAFQLNLANEQLMGRLSQMTMEYKKALKKIKELEDKDTRETLDIQKELLSNISTYEANSELPQSMAQLETLQKLEQSLNLIESLGLIDSPDLLIRKQELLSIIKGYESKLTQNIDVSQNEMQDIIVQTQDFIGGIKAPSPRPSSPNITPDDEEIVDQSISKIKADLKRIRKTRDSLRRDLKIEKMKVETLQQQIITLNNQLKANQEINQNDLLAYKAEIDQLKGVHKGKDNEDLMGRLLNMTALIESAKAERDLYKSKSQDAEEALVIKEDTIDQLNKQLDILMSTECKSMSEEIMFKDVDMERLREEREADLIMSNQQKQQLESAIAQNKLISKRCNELEQLLIRSKQELRKARDTIDDLNLKNALGLKFESEQEPKVNKATQVHYVTKPRVHVKSEDNFNKKVIATHTVKSDENPVHSTDISDNTKKEDNKITVVDSRTSSLSDVKLKIPTPTESPIHLSHQNSKIFTSTSSMLHASNQGSEGEFENEIDSEDLDTVAELIDPFENEGSQRYVFEDAPQFVHDPLKLNKKKAIKLPIVNNKPKTTRSMGFRRHLPNFSQQSGKSNEQSLSINGAPQGKRMLTGTIGKVKPTVTHVRYEPRTEPLPDGSDLTIIQSPIKVPQYGLSTNGTFDSYKHQNSIENCIDETNLNNVIQENSNYKIDKSLQSNPPLPLRITLVVHDKPEPLKEDQSPLVINTIPVIEKRKEKPTINNLNQGITAIKYNKTKGVNEATKLIEKLRRKINKVTSLNDQKDLEIIQLKQKISDLTLTIHRVKLDNIRSADELKRSKIRADNIKSRLDICFKEVGIRDDQIQNLKREIILLRRQQQPVNETLEKMKNAQRENNRLKNEQERRKMVAEVAKNALQNVTSESTKKHLSSILEHQQVTIARLEAQRRMWNEIERNHTMGVLGAMSLLSTSEYKTVRAVLPSYSPFASSKVSTLKSILKRPLINDNFSAELNRQETKIPSKDMITYSDKISVIDKIEPPLTNTEREMIVKQKETPQLDEKVVTFILSEKDKNTISKARFDASLIDTNV